jgi:protein tyrosine phosphatase
MRSGSGAKILTGTTSISPCRYILPVLIVMDHLIDHGVLVCDSVDDNRVVLDASNFPAEDDPTYINASIMDDDIACIAAAMPFNDVMRRDFWRSVSKYNQNRSFSLSLCVSSSSSSSSSSSWYMCVCLSRMIVDKRVGVVVMLNIYQQLNAGPYWPTSIGATVTYDRTVRVSLDATRNMSNNTEGIYAITRTLSICTRVPIALGNEDEKMVHTSTLADRSEEGFSEWSAPHKVVHLNYLNWPDMSTPETDATFIQFFLNADGCISDNWPNPVVVHCLAGAGRTGSFLAILSGFEKMRRYGGASLNFEQLLTLMRSKRANQVQTLVCYRAFSCYRDSYSHTLTLSLSLTHTLSHSRC